MIPVGDSFYYLAQISERADGENFGADLFRIDQSGLQTERLTTDGNSGIKKQKLKASADGRFLTYTTYYSSDINFSDPNSAFDANSSWIYDTQLGKSYKISDNSLYPTLIWQQ
jgi:hypothetical protein